MMARSWQRALQDLQVVADEDVGQAVLRLQVLQELDDLELDRAVQGRGRLVQDEESGLQHEGAGQGDPLPLAAGELVGVAVPLLRVQAHLPHRLDDQPLPVRRVPDLVDEQSFAR